ncbi:phage integrase central domain-containing protein [Bradyrhizobium sp. AUGA SZCCT0182]|uniref:tyrosine-type recombinase/integrase n=1 Tax=Bradyrhizobium sp. AUGA SZCCT0182 TaxID=2807667 RepID=UPI001BAACAAA|nr:integrase arm-type DNA-binding domain-containing protein [Bradyrhizobium sp. AUGA SZCCT0182]MBR1233669.1 tyrosine-type recombinase/integrase [Bradyrhizobium sp. AUGA SZCCT0182]
MAGKLKPLDVDRLVAPGKYSDGDGLYLVIAGPKSKNWSFRYWIRGKERWHGLGSFNDVSLREARVKRDAARQQVRSGVDIVQAKRSAREEAKTLAGVAAAPTFQECADRFIEENWTNWSKKHSAQWPSSLKSYAYPAIGHLKIGEIKPSHIFELLQPIWVEKAETANRVRGRIETVIAKNVDLDDTEFRNPAELTKQLREKLPKRPKRTQRHHPALPYVEAQQFWKELTGAAGTAAVALQFLILTVGRTNEVLGARWSEIDVTQTVWRIPGERMKMGEYHSVPLSDAALAVLGQMRDGTQSDLIFSNDVGEPFSDMAMLAVLKRMNYGHVTVHGFRATFATWAEECTDYPDGVREAALAHKYKNETTAAYQRGEKLEKRRALMNDWSSYLVTAEARTAAQSAA